MLVYGYLENNSLARTLLGGRYNISHFSWRIRTKICIGVAQGLAFLHDEVHPHIVHRDIKASNILLDNDFTPKISDFGLAKLFPAYITHVSTRVAGTLGYLAPDYAFRGKLTRNADVYSFGVLLLEIVSGRCNTNKRLPAEEQNLLERAWRLREKGELIQLVDEALEGDFNTEEASRYLKIGLLCAHLLPRSRPTMTTVVKLLKGEVDLDEKQITKPSLLTELMTVKGSPFMSSSSQSSNVSHATVTHTSISDRSN